MGSSTSVDRVMSAAGRWDSNCSIVRGPTTAEVTPRRFAGPVQSDAAALDLVDEVGGDVPQLAVGVVGLLGQVVEGGVGGQSGAAGHEDALRLVDDRPGLQGVLQVGRQG